MSSEWNNNTSQIPDAHNIFSDSDNFHKEGGHVLNYSNIKSAPLGTTPGHFKKLEEIENERRERQKQEQKEQKAEKIMKMQIKLADSEKAAKKVSKKSRIDPSTGFLIRNSENSSEDSLKRKIGKVVIPLINSAAKKNDKKTLQKLFNRICDELFEREVSFNEKNCDEKFLFRKNHINLMKKKAEKMMKEAGIFTEDMAHDLNAAAAEQLAANAQTDEDAW